LLLIFSHGLKRQLRLELRTLIALLEIFAYTGELTILVGDYSILNWDRCEFFDPVQEKPVFQPEILKVS